MSIVLFDKADRTGKRDLVYNEVVFGLKQKLSSFPNKIYIAFF